MIKTVGFALLMVGFSSFAIAGGGCPPPGCSAPEIDSGLAVGTLVLVGGAVLMIRSRLRR
jgi:hypothetical protein